MKKLVVVLSVALAFSQCTKPSGNKDFHKKEKEKLTEVESFEETYIEGESEGNSDVQAVNFSQTDHASLSFTAYKFTEKKGVGGKFQKIMTDKPIDISKGLSGLDGIKFLIPVSSLNTTDADRDKKIVEHFFNTINTSDINGTFHATNEKVSADITLNGQTHSVDFKITPENGSNKLNADIDVAQWGALPGIQALNQVCKDLHTGTDGVSKLWSTVSLEAAVW